MRARPARTGRGLCARAKTLVSAHAAARASRHSAPALTCRHVLYHISSVRYIYLAIHVPCVHNRSSYYKYRYTAVVASLDQRRLIENGGWIEAPSSARTRLSNGLRSTCTDRPCKVMVRTIATRRVCRGRDRRRRRRSPRIPRTLATPLISVGKVYCKYCTVSNVRTFCGEGACKDGGPLRVDIAAKFSVATCAAMWLPSWSRWQWGARCDQWIVQLARRTLS